MSDTSMILLQYQDKQNTEEKLAWSSSASPQAALYRSYLQSYEASR